MTSSPSNLFDTSPYTSLPRLDGVRLLALGRRIVAQAPRQLTPEQQSALNAVRDATQTLRDAVTPRLRAAGQGAARKKADYDIDTAWAALQLRTQAASYRDETRYPAAARAKLLLEQIFPDGLAFLTLEYEAEWGESEKRIALIDREKLGDVINELAGPGYLEDVRHFHQIYGDVLGMNAALPTAEATVSLADPMNALRLALTVYVLSLIHI